MSTRATFLYGLQKEHADVLNSEGWMLMCKKGQSHKLFDIRSWSKLYFRIKYSTREHGFYFYKSISKDEQPLGRIDLTEVQRVWVDKSHVIHLFTAQRDFLLRSLDPERNQFWYETLDRCSYTNEKKMDPQTIGCRYFRERPILISEFCEQKCKPIDSYVMSLFVNQGAVMLKTIFSMPEKDWKKYISSSLTTKSAVVSFIWLLVAKTATYDELWTSGVWRIDDPKRRIFEFLNSCPGVYPRISSHFTERIDESWKDHGHHRGLDIQATRHHYELSLPAGKKTLLFFRLEDKTTLIKLEVNGCPPFWKKDFRSWKNTVSWSLHGKDYLAKTIIAPSPGESKNPQFTSHTENVPLEFKRCYALALNILYPKNIMIEVPNEDEEEEGEESFDDSFDDDLAEEAEEEESDDIENIKELDVSILESVNTVQEEGRESREVGLPKKKKHKTKIRKRMTFLDSDSGGDSGEDGDKAEYDNLKKRLYRFGVSSGLSYMLEILAAHFPDNDPILKSQPPRPGSNSPQVLPSPTCTSPNPSSLVPPRPLDPSSPAPPAPTVTCGTGPATTTTTAGVTATTTMGTTTGGFTTPVGTTASTSTTTTTTVAGIAPSSSGSPPVLSSPRASTGTAETPMTTSNSAVPATPAGRAGEGEGVVGGEVPARTPPPRPIRRSYEGALERPSTVPLGSSPPSVPISSSSPSVPSSNSSIPLVPAALTNSKSIKKSSSSRRDKLQKKRRTSEMADGIEERKDRAKDKKDKKKDKEKEREREREREKELERIAATSPGVYNRLPSSLHKLRDSKKQSEESETESAEKPEDETIISPRGTWSSGHAPIIKSAPSRGSTMTTASTTSLRPHVIGTSYLMEESSEGFLGEGAEGTGTEGKGKEAKEAKKAKEAKEGKELREAKEVKEAKEATRERGGVGGGGVEGGGGAGKEEDKKSGGDVDTPGDDEALVKFLMKPENVANFDVEEDGGGEEEDDEEEDEEDEEDEEEASRVFSQSHSCARLDWSQKRGALFNKVKEAEEEDEEDRGQSSSSSGEEEDNLRRFLRRKETFRSCPLTTSMRIEKRSRTLHVLALDAENSSDTDDTAFEEPQVPISPSFLLLDVPPRKRVGGLKPSSATADPRVPSISVSSAVAPTAPSLGVASPTPVVLPALPTLTPALVPHLSSPQSLLSLSSPEPPSVLRARHKLAKAPPPSSLSTSPTPTPDTAPSPPSPSDPSTSPAPSPVPSTTLAPSNSLGPSMSGSSAPSPSSTPVTSGTSLPPTVLYFRETALPNLSGSSPGSSAVSPLPSLPSLPPLPRAPLNILAAQRNSGGGRKADSAPVRISIPSITFTTGSTEETMEDGEDQEGGKGKEPERTYVTLGTERDEDESKGKGPEEKDVTFISLGTEVSTVYSTSPSSPEETEDSRLTPREGEKGTTPRTTLPSEEPPGIDTKTGDTDFGTTQTSTTTTGTTTTETTTICTTTGTTTTGTTTTGTTTSTCLTTGTTTSGTTVVTTPETTTTDTTVAGTTGVVTTGTSTKISTTTGTTTTGTITTGTTTTGTITTGTTTNTTDLSTPSTTTSTGPIKMGTRGAPDILSPLAGTRPGANVRGTMTTSTAPDTLSPLAGTRPGADTRGTMTTTSAGTPGMAPTMAASTSTSDLRLAASGIISPSFTEDPDDTVAYSSMDSRPSPPSPSAPEASIASGAASNDSIVSRRPSRPSIPPVTRTDRFRTISITNSNTTVSTAHLPRALSNAGTTTRPTLYKREGPDPLGDRDKGKEKEEERTPQEGAMALTEAECSESEQFEENRSREEGATTTSSGVAPAPQSTPLKYRAKAFSVVATKLQQDEKIGGDVQALWLLSDFDPTIPTDYISISRKKDLLLCQIKAKDQATRPQLNDILPFFNKIKEKIELDRQRGYKGQRRGNEVCLPDPRRWKELHQAVPASKGNDGKISILPAALLTPHSLKIGM